jgi:hypothetical protein
MEGASACVAAVASSGRRFSNHTAHHQAASNKLPLISNRSLSKTGWRTQIA